VTITHTTALMLGKIVSNIPNQVFPSTRQQNDDNNYEQKLSHS